jgi:uncharacterized protein (TIGR02722 family)
MTPPMPIQTSTPSPRPFRARLCSSALIFACASLLLGTAGCATRSVDRTDVDEAIDLSGFWNDTDSRLVSEEMVRDCTSRPWASDWKAEKGKKPQVIVGTVRNASMEHINTGTFVKDLEREFVNSGRVGVVASRDQRGEVRSERADQADNADFRTMKDMGKELGADFMLVGQINQINDSVEGKQVRYYQVELELIQIESNEKAWIGQKKIKKLVKQRGYKF